MHRANRSARASLTFPKRLTRVPGRPRRYNRVLGSDSPPLDSPTPQPRWHFLHNVLWSWLAVIANLIIGFVLTPYVIRKLGSEGYGIWTLLFSLISYYGLLDLGMRSAV